MRRSIPLAVSALFVLTLAASADPCPIPDQSANARESGVMSWDTGFSGDEENTGAYMGVDIADITPDRLSALKLKDERGVEVTMVDQDAPAGKAGLKEHDVILTMNDTKVESGAQLRRMIRETPAGRVVTLGISREGQPMTLKVQLADRRKSTAWTHGPNNFKFEMPAMPNMSNFDMPVSVVVVHSSMRSGLMVENITPQLGEYFGAKDGKGVLVRSVEKGSRAEKAGFRAGDVIVRVNDQPVHDTSDFSHAIRSTDAGNVSVGIIRDKREQTLTLPLPERKDSGELFEESFDLPEFDAEANLDWAKMGSDLAELRPQMQFAIEESKRMVENLKPEIEKATQAAREEVERQRPEIEKAIREAQSAATRASEELCRSQRELREQTRKLQRDLQKQRREMLRENRKQFERLRHELHGDWMQI
jgi:serine protease Do